MNPIRLIGDTDTVLVFALGGVPGHAVHAAEDAAEARAVLEGIVDEVHRAGGAAQHPVIVLITQGVAAHIRDDLDAAARDAHGPLVLEIPGFGEPVRPSPMERFVGRILGAQR